MLILIFLSNSFFNSFVKMKNEKRTVFRCPFFYENGKRMRVIRSLKVPFNFHFKIGMENDIFVYLNFDSKLKIEKRQFSIFNFY